MFVECKCADSFKGISTSESVHIDFSHLIFMFWIYFSYLNGNYCKLSTPRHSDSGTYNLLNDDNADPERKI